MSEEILDVAIVGGGVAGVYAAWRLRTDPPKGQPVPDVQVFELSQRIGGRLLSVSPPDLPGVFCELGGMRYISSQTLVRSLIEDQLNLQTEAFSVGEPENINYMRGKRFRTKELAEGVRVPYDLHWSERGVPISDLIGNVLDRMIPGITNMSGAAMRDFLRGWEVDGRPMHEWGFWNLLARGMSHEAYELARVTSGYDTAGLNWNAFDTISLNFDLASDVTFHRLPGGYQQVPLTLAKQFEQAGGTINRGQRLVSFDTGEDGTVVLQVEDVAGGRCHTVRARKLVLAMPRRSLELLEPTGPVMDRSLTAVRSLIESVIPIPLFKLFVAYEFPWWESVGVDTGRSVTDLPVRQCYYWATAKSRDNHRTHGVLLASYDDSLNVDFWAGLAGPHLSPHPGAQDWKSYEPPGAMIDEVDRQLRELHDVRYAPTPYTAAYIDWSIDPFGGGVNFWKVGAKSWEVIPRIVQPVADVPVFICGEAYSNGQGWVEGALETTELVLQQHLGLAPPAWAT